MAIHKINTGTSANNGTGDSLRVGGQKINSTFDHFDKEIKGLQGTSAKFAFDTLQQAQDKWASFTQAEKDEMDGKTFVLTGVGEYKWDLNGGVEQVKWFTRETTFPFASLNEVTAKYKDAVLELFIYETPTPGDVYILNSLRRSQVSSVWGEQTRWEVGIRNMTSGEILFNYYSYDHDEGETGIQILGNEKAKIIIDWNKISVGDGYGSVSNNYELSREVFSVDVNPRIQISKLKTEVEEHGSLLENTQERINPNADIIDYSDYLVNGSVDGTTGEIENLSTRRTIEKFPVDTSKNYIVRNTADTESGKRVAVFDSSENLLRIVSVTDMTDWVFTPQAGDAYVSITLVSALGDVGLTHTIEFWETSESGLFIKEINGFSIKAEGTEELTEHLSEDNPHNIDAEKIGAISHIVAGGSAIPKSNSTVTLENSTPSKAGLMSKADKAKLDGIAVSPINISGSGITKNASAFGFLPTEDAETNSIALQEAVNGGGTILVDYPGTYDLNRSILLPSNTTLIFGANVFINKVSYNYGITPTYTFINEGAFTKEYNENIKIIGLHIICNGIGNGNDLTQIRGLRGQIAFHYIKNLEIRDFTILDGESSSYVIHICTFENIKILNTHVEGDKDAVHLGKGKTFVIRDGYFRTYDDPIALNAHDYASGNPELGWIENGIIENCYDLEAPETTGYFARILAGAWVDWFSGMEIQNSDTVVSNGRMYRAFNSPDGTLYTSLTQPTHESGMVTHEGINWQMIQDSDITYTVGVRNVVFRNIFLQKSRGTAFSFHFDTGDYSRSYYPNAETPVQEDIVFENIFCEADIPFLVSSRTPINTIKFINSTIRNSKINIGDLSTPGLDYGTTRILFSGVTFKGSGVQTLVDGTKPMTVKIIGSIKENDSYSPEFDSRVVVLESDL